MESKRQRQVNQIILQNMAEVFRQEGYYIYGEALVTVIDAKVTPDLMMAKVYISIFNTEEGDKVFDAIKASQRKLSSSLYARVKNKLRKMPKIFFEVDQSLDNVSEMEEILRKLREDGGMG